MALIMKCDVCGVSYEPYNTEHRLPDESPNSIRLVTYTIGNTNGIGGKRYDLCPKCMQKILDVIQHADN